MDAKFLALSDAPHVAIAVVSWVKTADTDRFYSMVEIVDEMYGVEFDTDEFWRVASRAGDTLRECGFRQVNYKNRRIWVKKPESK